ncbi:hypothetical protein T492DRAFT_556118, partial [Pavlovales sp. CCMP2436]
YYFSEANLSMDAFMRSQMGPQNGRVPLALLCSFNRMRSLSDDLALVVEALGESQLVDVSPDGVRAREGWESWL